MIIPIIFQLFFNYILFWFNPFVWNQNIHFTLLPVFILPGIIVVLVAYRNTKKALFRQILFSVLINFVWAMLLLDFLQGDQCGGFPNVCVA